jgi:ribosomal protein S18 acetylase RimI-like enzyme
LEIRPATSADVRAIAAVHVASWQDAYAGIVPDEEIAKRDVDTRAEQWKELVGNAIVAVADDGAVVGFAAAEPRTGEIRAIYIAPQRTRSGIGTKLLHAAHERLRRAGRTEAHLWVLAANEPARAFYAAHGYEADGTTELIYGQLMFRLSVAL